MIDRGTGTLEKTSGPGKNDPFQERYNQLDHNQTLSDNYQQFIDKLKLTPDQDYTNPLAPIRNHQFGQLSPVEERIADRRTMVGSAFSGDKMIARAQANLAIAGYELDGEGFKGVNGKEGPKTTQAVKDFQTAAGLKPTGIIDQETIKAMDLAAEKGMTKQEIEALGNQIAKQNEPPPVGDQPQEHQLTPELTPQEQQQLAKRDDLVKQAYSTTKGGNYQLAQAQASLELAGYKLEKHGIDGKMGDETRANLRQFQKDWGIPETSDFYETYYALREATVKEWKRPPEQKVEQEPGKQPVKELKSELTPKLEKEDMIPHYTGTYDKAAQFNRIGKILPQKNFVYDQVKDSQTKLKEMGFNIGPAGADGKIGKYTREAVIEFQKMNHLKITGELDKDTAAQIESEYQKGTVVKSYNPTGHKELKIERDNNILSKKTGYVSLENQFKIGDKGLLKVELPGVGETFFERQLIPNLKTFIDRCKKELGVDIQFKSVFRSKEYQQHLYDVYYYEKTHNQKRSPENLKEMNEHGLWGTNVVSSPDKAPHAMGSAFDLRKVNELIKNGKFEDVIKIAKECGFQWQGAKDKVHFGNYEFEKLGYKSREEMIQYNDKIYRNSK